MTTPSNVSGESQGAAVLSPKIVQRLEEAVQRVKEKGASPSIVHLVSSDRDLAMQAAQTIARLMDRPLVQAAAPKVSSEIEAHLNQVFTPVRGSGSILFFDEADALFGKRTEVKDSHDRFANRETSFLLQQVERSGGVAIVATNSDSSTVPGTDPQTIIHLAK
jgi:broad specificity phosphatase PhoE